MAGRPTSALARLGAAIAAAAPLGLLAAQPPSLADLSIEELANLEITSVSRRAERLGDAPASIYVITAEDIRRSGVTSLPEALRLAPNLQVARADAGQYAISARGFNNSIGNKLLVLVDGRTIYTPLFSGVFWDQQDLMLEDVERIEVISGPGGTLWGANAVNGVINVITRRALGNDPEFQWMLRSSLDIASNQEFDATVRRVGDLPNPPVPEYTAVDLRYGWRVRRDMEISLTVRNAFDPEHPELNAAPGRSEIARSVFLRARWSL